MSISPTYARRDRFVCWLANQVMRLASTRYRAMVGGAMRYGLEAAAKDAIAEKADLADYVPRCRTAWTPITAHEHAHTCFFPATHTGDHHCLCGGVTGQYLRMPGEAFR